MSDFLAVCVAETAATMTTEETGMQLCISRYDYFTCSNILGVRTQEYPTGRCQYILLKGWLSLSESKVKQTLLNKSHNLEFIIIT